MKLELWYPAKPFVLSQPWGVYNPAIYAQFGFSRHNGIDIHLGRDSRVYAPFDCIVYRIGYQPKGGGVFCSVISKNTYTFDDGKQAQVLIDFLHLERVTAFEGTSLSLGEEIAIADNTGFSTGPHTHVQFRRVLWDGKSITGIDANDANNSFDPTPYWTGQYASDVRSYITQLTKLVELLKKLLGQRSN